MKTGANVLKTILEGATYSAYRGGNAPTIKIKGKDKLDTARPDKVVYLENKTAEPLFTFNNKVITGSKFVDLEIRDPDPDERDNFLDDFDDLILASSHDITYSITGYEDELSPYITKLKVKIK